MSNCIFCKIINKEITAQIIYEDDDLLMFNDIQPKAPIHFLTIPKKHIVSLIEAQPENQELLGKILLKSAEVAKIQGLTAGFKTQINNGIAGGQEVFHLHVHTFGELSHE